MAGQMRCACAVLALALIAASSTFAAMQSTDDEPDSFYYENSPAPSPGACPVGTSNATLTEEITQGPYWLDELLFRSDITEGQGGVALEARITVLDAACNPVVGAYVDMWHCNATGTYSGYTSENPGGSLAPASDGRKLLQAAGATDNTTFLRGTVQTDANGVAVFHTIVPGWYSGRTTHVHAMVHVTDADGSEAEEYQQSHSAHTGQFYFEEDLLDAVYATYPYSRHTGERIALNDDGIFASSGSDHTQIWAVNWASAGNVSAGLVASATAVIDPSASHSTSFSMGGGGMGPMPGGMGAGGLGPMPGGGAAFGPRPAGGIPQFAGRRLLTRQ